MAATGLGTDTQLFGGPACHTQSMHQCLSCTTSLSASFDRWATTDGPDKPATGLSKTARPAVQAPAVPVEPTLHARLRDQSNTFVALTGGLGLCPCAFVRTVFG